jgi:hypothetical protein
MCKEANHDLYSLLSGGRKVGRRGIRFLLGGRLLEFRLSSGEGVFSSYLPEKAISTGDPKAILCIRQSVLGLQYK